METKNLIIICVTAIICVCVIAGAAYINLGDNSNGAQTDNNDINNTTNETKEVNETSDSSASETGYYYGQCTTHGWVRLNSDKHCPECVKEGRDPRVLKNSIKWVSSSEDNSKDDGNEGYWGEDDIYHDTGETNQGTYKEVNGESYYYDQNTHKYLPAEEYKSRYGNYKIGA